MIAKPRSACLTTVSEWVREERAAAKWRNSGEFSIRCRTHKDIAFVEMQSVC